MDYNEFGERIKSKYPEYKDMDNLELSKRIVAKYPEYKEQVSFEVNEPTESIQKGIDITPSGIARNTGEFLGDIVSTPIKAAIEKRNIPEVYRELRQNDVSQPNALKDFVTDTAVYSALPMLRGFKGANALTGLYQGGLIGGLEGLKEGKNPIQSALSSGVTGMSINALLPPAIKGLTSQKVKNILSGSIPWLKPETVRQSVKPNSVALDLNENTAQNLLMDTTERIRNAYNKITSDKGNVVGNLLQELPEDIEFKVGDILQDYDKIYNNYSLSRNESLNPAINATKKEYAKIEDMLYSNADKNINEFNQELDTLKYPKMNLEVLRGKRKGNFYTKSLDSMQNNIEFAYRKFNADIINKIKSNPELLENQKEIEHFVDIIQDMNNRVPDEVIDDMYRKLYQIVGSGDKLNKMNYTINPKELYDINKNISDMTDWKAIDAVTKNDVLEQMYGANADRISSLSPELAQANKEYSQLMDFRNNEGINKILNKQERIDTASSALKNYNNTITKGNTNRNIQDLENILIKEGEEPFLNTIDDINAAQDLLSTPTTGFNPFGLTNMVKRLTNPVLKGIRGINRFNQQYTPNWEGLSDNIRRLLTIGSSKNVPILYGGISND